MSETILVYSSVGDVSNAFKLWSPGCDESYMCAHTYYGGMTRRAKEIAEASSWFEKHPGSKFQNLAWAWKRLPPADWIVVTDDDISLTKEQITGMVTTMAERGYKVGAPSHDPKGRMSWKVMMTQPSGGVRDSPFVEMTIVIFRRDALETFLEHYTPVSHKLLGYGIDYIISSVCPGPFAIFDSVSIVNPTNEQKGIRVREIERLQPFRLRKKAWEQVLRASGGKFKTQNLLGYK